MFRWHSQATPTSKQGRTPVAGNLELQPFTIALTADATRIGQ